MCVRDHSKIIHVPFGLNQSSGHFLNEHPRNIPAKFAVNGLVVSDKNNFQTFPYRM